MRSSILILYVLLASMLTACQHTGNVYGMNDMMEVEEYRPCDHVSMYSDYRFGDNALGFKLGKSSYVSGRGIVLSLTIAIGDEETDINLHTKHISDRSLTHGRYDNDKALGLLENEEYMNALWQALLSDEGHDQIKHVYVAIDLLNNSSQYIDQASQKETALVLETLVMLLRPSLRETFIDYLEAVSEEKSWLSAAAMHAFFFDGGSPRISAEDRQYKFGDNTPHAIDAYPRTKDKQGEEHIIVRHSGKFYCVKTSIIEDDQKWLAPKQNEENYYQQFFNDLWGTDKSKYPHIIEDLMQNTSNTLGTFGQRDAAAYLEILVALARQNNKTDAANRLIGAINNKSYKDILHILQNQLQEEYYQVYAWQLQKAERWEQELNEYSEEDEGEE